MLVDVSPTQNRNDNYLRFYILNTNPPLTYLYSVVILAFSLAFHGFIIKS